MDEQFYIKLMKTIEHKLALFITDIDKRYKHITRQDVWDILMYELLPKI